jgi:ribosome maturation factor RimP
MDTVLHKRLVALAEPIAIGLGYELVDIEFVASRNGGVLRVYIDRAEGISVEDCANMSHALSAQLDTDDPLPGAYNLEVSSPGFDRVLRTPAHYARFVGSRVKAELAIARDGRRRYTGELLGVSDAGIELEVDGQKVSISFAEISKTRLAPL